MKETTIERPLETHDLLMEVKGEIGWLTLNRPKVLNALSLNMIREMAQILKEWEETPLVKAVVLQSSNEKAFCAGGDIRAIYEAKLKGDLETCEAFFRKEYTLNAYIYHYKKPYVSLINGIAMGGGLGVSINGSHRIVTEKSLLAMPETAIGFFPDVGATTFLNALPNAVGLYLGLTGMRLNAEDAFWSGLATHFMPSSALPLFVESLQKGTPLEEALKTHCGKLKEKGFLETHFEVIQNHFSKPSLKEICESLSQDSSLFAQSTYKLLLSKSPTSLAVVFRQLKEVGPFLSFKERMKLEFRLSQHLIGSHDFTEGVRAVLVDKDQTPRWNPPEITDLTPDIIDSYFNSLGNKELVL